MKLIYSLACALAMGTLFALGACSSKPPGCADDETRTTVKELIVSEAKKPFATEDDPDGLIGQFLSKATVELSQIVDDGVRKEGNKQMCKAHVKVMPPSGDGLEGDSAYTTQRVLDQNGKFLLEMEGADQLAMALVSPARSYYRTHRYLGTYGGTYACGGVGDAQDGPRGPFSAPVSMVVAPGDTDDRPAQATLERISRGGGVEKLAGQLSGVISNSFQLEGYGENTPDDRWLAKFEIEVKGNTAKGTGFISVPGVGIVRHCTLDLTRGASATKAVVAPTASVVPAAVQPTPATPTDVQSPTGGMASAFVGNYVGEGDGTVSLKIGQPNSSGSYPVSLSTQAAAAGGGGCGGGADGNGKVQGGVLMVTATDASIGATCSVNLTPDGKGGLHSEEGSGCSSFHGAACGFRADLVRK